MDIHKIYKKNARFCLSLSRGNHKSLYIGVLIPYSVVHPFKKTKSGKINIIFLITITITPLELI
jgi:hypothetical protein